MTHYQNSERWILAQKQKHSALSESELKTHCAKNYPFGYRSGHSYRAFIKAMRDLFPAKPIKANKKRSAA